MGESPSARASGADVERFREIVEGSPDVLFELDMEGAVVYCSPSAQALSGWTPDELVGKSAFDLIREEDHGTLRETLDHKGAALMAPREYRLKTKSGEARWVRVHGRPRIEDGKVVGILGVMGDICDSRRQWEELRAAKEAAESYLETARVLVIILDTDGRIRHLNRSLERLCGGSLEDVKGKDWIGSFVAEQGRANAKNVFAIAPDDTSEQLGTVAVVCAGGAQRMVEWHVRNLKDAQGRITGVVATGMDVTAAVEKEEALRESEAKYRAIFENLHDTYFRTDLQDTLIMASPSGEAIFGYKVEEALGMNLSGFYVDLKKRDDVLKMLSEKGYVREFEARLRRKDGSVIWVSSNCTFWFDKNGNIGGVEGITRDITERKVAEEERAALQEQLRHAQKMEAIGTLAGGIAHDFNNLLTSIMGCANMLKSLMSEEDRGYSAVDVIERASARASELTKQLLGFARKGKLKNAPVDMHGVIDDTVTIMGRTFDRKISLERKLGPSRPIVMGDSSQLQQVTMNLTVNARDAMPDGGHVTIATSVETLDEEYSRRHPEVTPGEYLRIAVSDDGPGIPEDIRDRIFEPFFTTKPSGVGTGMGLATVYGIVKNHGGTVSFETETGEGTTFNVFLPLCPSGTELPEDAQEGVASSGAGRILVVDDEDTVRETVEMMLTMLGYDVATAANGKEAIAYYEKSGAETALVILDMTMPQMNGSECFHRLREIDPEVKVLLSTGHAIEGAAQELLNTGMVGLVQKPYIAPQLAEAVAKALM